MLANRTSFGHARIVDAGHDAVDHLHGLGEALAGVDQRQKVRVGVHGRRSAVGHRGSAPCLVSLASIFSSALRCLSLRVKRAPNRAKSASMSWVKRYSQSDSATLRDAAVRMRPTQVASLVDIGRGPIALDHCSRLRRWYLKGLLGCGTVAIFAPVVVVIIGLPRLPHREPGLFSVVGSGGFGLRLDLRRGFGRVSQVERLEKLEHLRRIDGREFLAQILGRPRRRDPAECLAGYLIGRLLERLAEAGQGGSSGVALASRMRRSTSKSTYVRHFTR